jgi:hypothetical protein
VVRAYAFIDPKAKLLDVGRPVRAAIQKWRFRHDRIGNGDFLAVPAITAATANGKQQFDPNFLNEESRSHRAAHVGSGFVKNVGWFNSPQSKGRTMAKVKASKTNAAKAGATKALAAKVKAAGAAPIAAGKVAIAAPIAARSAAPTGQERLRASLARLPVPGGEGSGGAKKRTGKAAPAAAGKAAGGKAAGGKAVPAADGVQERLRASLARLAGSSGQGSGGAKKRTSGVPARSGTGKAVPIAAKTGGKAAGAAAGGRGRFAADMERAKRGILPDAPVLPVSHQRKSVLAALEAIKRAAKLGKAAELRKLQFQHCGSTLPRLERYRQMAVIATQSRASR